ncbi:MAG: hypothetical protein EBR88_05835, partial [Betaproteobacteria bacterium]|nr:hypothetical protein [Betaproteobacteria bacterium]
MPEPVGTEGKHLTEWEIELACGQREGKQKGGSQHPTAREVAASEPGDEPVGQKAQPCAHIEPGGEAAQRLSQTKGQQVDLPDQQQHCCGSQRRGESGERPECARHQVSKHKNEDTNEANIQGSG